MTEEVVGRERELGAAGEFLQLLERDCVALVIEGQPGIGKTTLWLEVVGAAKGRPYNVLQARSAEAEATLSYGALSDLVGDAFEETRAALPAPQERALATALLRAPADRPADPRTTAVALVSILTILAEARPTVVAVDDVQWLDSASERALAFAARRLPPRLGLLVTRRGGVGEEAPLGLDRALAGDRVHRLVPGPLSLGAIHHIIKGRLGTSLPHPLLARVVAAAGGNPFFALEIARAMAREPADRAIGDPLPVPRSLQELVRARAGALSAATQEALLAVAMLPAPTIAALAETLGPNVDIGHVMLDAEDAGMVTVERGRIHLAHPLLGSIVYGAASEERRRRLHRHLAERVGDPEERARHLALSTTEPEQGAATVVERGARQAAHRGAPDAAAELFEASHRLTPRHRRVDLARRLLGHASALNAVGDFAGARSIAENAIAVSPSSSLRAQALSLLAGIAWLDGAADAAIEHLEAALAAASDDRVLQGPIYAKLVRFNFTLDFERAFEHTDAAMRALDERREPVLLAHVLIDRVFASALLGREVEPELLQRGLALEAEGLPTAKEAPHPIPLIWLNCMDEFEAARERHAMEDRWYRERGDEVWRANRLVHRAPVELRAGRWDLAERYAEEGSAVLERMDVHGPMALVFEKRALVDAHRGRIDRARSTLVRLIEEFEGTDQRWWATLSLSTLAFVEFAAGDYAAADRTLVRMREHAESLRVKDIIHDRSEPFHIESVLALGEVDRARDILLGLEERGRRLPRLWITVTLPRARALVRSAEGDLASALAALEELDLDLASRLPFDLGWTLLVKGRLLRRAKQKRTGAEALRHALDIFEQLGAPHWIEQGQAELQRVGLRPPTPSDLTESERRVAELVAKGLTRREVAARLFMSPKTVEANLGHVYRKLGIHSRAELGAYLASSGTASPQN